MVRCLGSVVRGICGCIPEFDHACVHSGGPERFLATGGAGSRSGDGVSGG